MPNQPQELFDAHAWMRTSLREAPLLQPTTLDIISGFTALWGLFEGVLCKGRVSVDGLGVVAGRLVDSNPNYDTVERLLLFYRFRYISAERTNSRFHGLNLRPSDRKELVEAVLKGTDTDPVSKLHALLIIAYRIRNNMFHGLKSLDTWDDQAQNISEAARILAFALETLGTYIVQNPTERN